MFLNRSLSSSVSITATASSTSISDAVSTTNPADIYKFNLAQRASVNLLASGLSADVNIAIVRDSNANGIVNDGEILGRSENVGTTIENIQLANLAAGDYFIIVEAGANVASANYSLNLGANKVTGADILWRDTDNDQVGYWRFDGTTYRDTKVITPISDDWKVEAIGDFDGDKSEDILWRNKVNGELVAYLMDGASGTIRSQATLKHPVTGITWPVDQGWQVIGIGDVNGDGKGDIIWRNVAASAVSIWLMNGTQVLGATPTYADGVGLTVGAGFNLVAVADLSGDGKADLLWQHSSGVVIDWVMDGATRLGAVTMSNLPPAGYKIEAVNDFNGDGKGDLFWRNSVGNVEMWLGTGQIDVYQATPLSSTSNLPVSTVDMAWQIAGTDDFNGDGKADVAWRHQTLGVMSLWSMNGSQVNYMQNVALPNLSQKAVGASTRLETANIIQLAGISDSGASNQDGITNIRTPLFAGVTNPGTKVSLFANGQLIGEKVASSNGTWEIISISLADGSYDIVQKLTNSDGIITIPNPPIKLRIDGTAPILGLTSNLTSAPLTSTSRFTGSLGEVGTGITSLKYRLGTGVDIVVPVGADGKFDQVLNFVGVPTGATTLMVTTTDVAGNVVTTSYNVTVPPDTQAPSITASFDGSNISQPKVVVAVADDRGVQGLQARLNGQAQFTTIAVDALTGNYVVDLKQLNGGNPLATGTAYTVSLQAKDTSNNISAPQSVQVYLTDVTKPIDIPVLTTNGTAVAGQLSLTAPNSLTGPKTPTGQAYNGPVSLQQNAEGAIKIDIGNAVCTSFKYTPSSSSITSFNTSSSRPPDRYDYKLYAMGGSGGGVAIGGGNFVGGNLTITEFAGSGGLRSGTYLLAPDYVPVKALSEIDSNPDENCVACRARKQFNADASVELHSGAVLKTENLVSYQSKDQTHTWGLSYNSLRADPRPIVHFGYDDIGTNIKDNYLMSGLLKVKTSNGDVISSGYTSDVGIAGAKIGENYWKLPLQGGPLQGALQIDMRGQASGVYDYDLETGIKVLCGCMVVVGGSTTLRDKLVVVNGADSDFGTGWGISGLQKIYETTTKDANNNLEYNALVVDGSGDYAVFRSTNGGVTYTSGNGDFSVLTKQNGKFTRTTKEGLVYAFNTDNQLVSTTDRNGQITQMVYDVTTKRLVKVVDAAGLETKFAYGIASGKIESITDPANRITQLTYETYTLTSNGSTQYRLKAIKDPDTLTRSFGYTANVNPALLTSDVNKRAHVSTITYDELTGRAKQAIDKDGQAITNVSPAQIQGVRATTETKNPGSMTLPIAGIPELTKNPFSGKTDQAATANYKDPAQTAGLHAGSNTTYLNRAQEEVYAKDEFGTLQVIARNNNYYYNNNRGLYLPTSVTDARGQKVSYRYDSNGNIIEVSDLLANGTAAPGSFFPDAERPGPYSNVVAVDWNRDGKVDLISNSSDVTVAYGDGKGQFSAPVKLANYARRMLVGDLNNDGQLDLITADYDKVYIYLSNLDQTLNAPVDFSIPQSLTNGPPLSGVSDLVLADLNGDNAPDIFVMGGDGYGVEKWQMTLKNNGLGVFTDPANGVRQNPLGLLADGPGQGSGGSQILVGDINGDNRQDIVLVLDSKALILLGQLSGGLSVGTPLALTYQPNSIAALGHFSSATKNDLLISGDGKLRIYAGDGLGGFAAPTTQALDSSVNTFRDSLRDVNGDGVLDLVTEGRYRGGAYGNATQFSVSYGAIGGIFGPTQVYSTDGPNGTGPICWGDLDGNGQIDLLLRTPNTISSLQQQTDHSFIVQSNASAPLVNPTRLSFDSSTTPQYLSQMVVGDISGDWVPDLIALTSTGLSVRLNYGDGTYADPFTVGLTGNNQAIVAGDLNGDGAQDIVVASNTGALTIVMSDGKGKFLAPQASLSVGGNPTTLMLQDLNGDGKLDLVSTNTSANNVSVLFGTGTGGFTTGANYAVGTSPQAMSIGDLNGDGKLDIAVANTGSNSVSVLLNSGTGRFAAAVNYALTASPTAVAIGDVNGDGKRDLVVGTNSATDNLWVFSGQAGALPLTTPQKYTFGTQAVMAVAIADMDGDGKLDVVATTGTMANSYGSKVYVQLAGATTFAVKQRYQFNAYYNAGALTLADMDLDGAIDIVTVDNINSRPEAVVRLNDRLRLTLPQGLGKRVTEYDKRFDPTTGTFAGGYSRNFNQVTRTVDELGRQMIYQLDDNTGNVLRSIRVQGTIDSAAQLTAKSGDDLVTDYSYTTDGRVLEMRDALNHVTRYDYTVDAKNVGGQVRRVYSAYGTVDQAMQEYEYDAAGNRTASIDEYGNRSTYTYKAGTNLLATMAGADPDGAGPLLAPVSSYVYDENGNEIQMTSPDPDGTGPRSAAVTTNQYDKMNRLIKMTSADPDGTGPQLAAVTTYGYDLNGNQTSMVDALGRQTEMVYDSRDRLTSTLRKNATGTVLNTSSRLYDGINQTTGTIDANGKRSNTVYDQRGRRTRSIDALGNVTRFVYDAANQMVAQVDAKGNMTRFVYDDLGRQIKSIDANGNSTQTIYDKNGNVTAQIDANGNRSESRYDNRDRVVRTYDANNTIIPEASRKFTETKYGRVLLNGVAYQQTQIIDPNVNATTYVYDGLGRLSTDTNQLGKIRTYKYDAVGNQIEAVDRNNLSRTFEYDTLNRQTKENWVNAGTVTRSLISKYNVLNQLVDITDQTGTGTKLSQYAYGYDDLDRVKSIDNLGIGGVARVALNYTYDAEGNIKSVADAINGTLAGTITYDYDALNRATQISQSGTGITNKRVKLTYNALSQMESLQRLTGSTFTQSVATTTYGYNDPLNRLTQIQHANATGTTLSSFAFTYDSGSRIKKIQNADGTFVNYDYANNNELKVADYSPTTRVDEAYTYDANGNRTNVGYVTGSNNQLSADGKYAYTYDDEGNLKTRKDLVTNVVRTFNWDYRNRLMSVVEGAVTVATYTYDAGNKRISKTTGGVTTRYVYDRGHVTMEFNGTGPTPTVRYLYGMQVDQILAQDKGAGNVSWALTDQLGSVRALVGNDGVVRNRFEYDAFGTVVSTMSGATDDSRYRYTGREFDGETGLYYYRARYFDSNSGRFIGQDPIGFRAGDSNLYRYVGNDTINKNDPSGMRSLELSALLATANNGHPANREQTLDRYPELDSYGEALETAMLWFRVTTLRNVLPTVKLIPQSSAPTTKPRWSLFGDLIDDDKSYQRPYRGKALVRPGGASGGIPTIDLYRDDFRRSHNTPGFEHVTEIKFKYKGPQNLNPTPPCPSAEMSNAEKRAISRFRETLQEQEAQRTPTPAPFCPTGY
jgi:RHS repeat-associated protein